ncbi:MAG: TlpA disulfide reductase family protein, partial [Polyangiaceae bacterium]
SFGSSSVITLVVATRSTLGAACSSPAPASPAQEAAAPSRGPVRTFSYASLDERPVTSDALRGRATIVAFVATNGDASVVQLKYLQKIQSDYKPAVQIVAVFMDPTRNPDNTPLVRIYRDSLKLTFPTAMADANTVPGNGPFGNVGVAPTVVVLDASGAEVWRKTGVSDATELTHALRDAQRH